MIATAFSIAATIALVVFFLWVGLMALAAIVAALTSSDEKKRRTNNDADR